MVRKWCWNSAHKRYEEAQDSNGVTCFYLEPGKEFEKWCTQNGAVYTGVCEEGVLLDNFVMATKRGYAAFYAHYRNEWSSDYYVEFQKGAAQDVWRKWYAFVDMLVALEEEM